MPVAEECIEILRATRDGEDLAPTDLALVQLMANGGRYGVSEAAEVAFSSLLARVRAGYVKPWLHGVEHLTIDLTGYVYWKDRQIEHWSGEIVVDPMQGRPMAKELARRCRILEARGEEISTTAVIWRWEDDDALAQ